MTIALEASMPFFMSSNILPLMPPASSFQTFNQRGVQDVGELFSVIPAVADENIKIIPHYGLNVSLGIWITKFRTHWEQSTQDFYW